MDPLTGILIGGSILQGLGGILGARSQDKAAEANRRMMQRRYEELLGFIEPRLGQGPGAGEQMLLDILTQGSLFNNQAFNTGQDALMQMLRSDPISTEELFASWEPLEMRALDQALAEGWAQAAGLGQRFGSASRREEGRIRGEAAENAISRRAQTSFQAEQENAELQAMAAQLLSNLGLAQSSTQLQGLQLLAQLEAGRQGADINLLSLLAGLPIAAQQPSAMPGAIGDIGQLAAFLPLFLQMYNQN